jgi:tetrahydromethanopterin S-methyltransferase subunit E
MLGMPACGLLIKTLILWRNDVTDVVVPMWVTGMMVVFMSFILITACVTWVTMLKYYARIEGGAYKKVQRMKRYKEKQK